MFLLPVVAQEESEMLDYPPPSSDYPSNGYNRDEFFKEKSQGTRERIYPVGMSDDGLLCYATELPNIRCECDAFQVTVKDLADKRVLWEQELEGLHRGNFWIYRDAILLTTTGDNHHIRLLNRFTGKQQDQTPLNSTPKWVLVWDDQLHVYTEKGPLLFSLESSFFRAP